MRTTTTHHPTRRGDRRPLSLAALLAAGALLAPAPATAADPGAGGSAIASAPAAVEEHCVVEVVGQDPDGRLRTTAPVCSSSRPEALRRAGVGPAAKGSTAEGSAAEGSGTASSTFVIGAHFDGQGFTGSSFSVVGVDCAGGWLNTPWGWGNRISSTLHGCPRINHFDGSNLVAPLEQTLAPGANLGALDNRTSSLQYLS